MLLRTALEHPQQSRTIAEYFRLEKICITWRRELPLSFSANDILVYLSVKKVFIFIVNIVLNYLE